MLVEGTRGRGRSRKTWEQCVRDDMKLLGLHPEWTVFRDNNNNTQLVTRHMSVNAYSYIYERTESQARN